MYIWECCKSINLLPFFVSDRAREKMSELQNRVRGLMKENKELQAMTAELSKREEETRRMWEADSLRSSGFQQGLQDYNDQVGLV